MTILTWMHLIIHEYLIDFSMVSIILHGFQGACSAQQNFLPCFPSFLPSVRPSFLPSVLPSFIPSFLPSSPSLPFLSFSFLFLSFPPTSCYCFYTVFFWSDFFFLDPDFFLIRKNLFLTPPPENSAFPETKLWERRHVVVIEGERECRKNINSFWLVPVRLGPSLFSWTQGQHSWHVL